MANNNQTDLKVQESRSRGRPLGGGQQAIKVMVEPVVIRCQAVLPSGGLCGSSERSAYFNVRRHEHDGFEIVWRSCTCSACGQLRTERTKTPID